MGCSNNKPAQASASAGASEHSQAFRRKMEREGLKKEFIEGWLSLYEKYVAGDTGIIPESSILPVEALPELASLPSGDKALLKKTVMLKLNGGLGTGMGLDKAKSLLKVKGDDTFLDLIAKQVLKLREEHPVKFMLMNSFSTEADTKEFFKKYPQIHKEWEQVSFLQNKAPKVEKETKRPGEWPSKPSAEWCPPGHGDIYAAMVVAGKLEKLVAAGYKYMFVSNSDNLGATIDMRLLGYLHSTGAPMLMEVCVRGEDDKKGGHLAKTHDGKLTLRESAQCTAEDEKHFQDISKHRFFNTNNLWLNLEKLKAAMKGGVLPLPLIVNEKKMDPASKENPGPKVIQLETAMGAAIHSLPGSVAVCVPFSRFAPVKTCNQLLGLRSDAYVISEEFTPVLAPGACKPVVKLDDIYKMVPDMEAMIREGVPSLKDCEKLTIKGRVKFASGATCKGKVTITNQGSGEEEVGSELAGDVVLGHSAQYAHEFREKMLKEGLKPAFVQGWLKLYERYVSGDTGIVPEGAISPVTELPELASLPEADASLLKHTVMLKLNGGLGTGMGLNRAKSLLEVKEGNSFLDLIAKQVLRLRKEHPVKFMLMNSFSTEADTKEFFKKYPEIHSQWEQVSFMQNMSPKIDKESKKPGNWPSKPSAEWCPPGHGDIYAALVVSGKLEKLIADGYKYMFVSNSDNLGATIDLKLLGHLASTEAPMLMEVCVRGEDDKKGGHLARTKDGKLTLRESAQCNPEDEKHFQDITKHRFFNTNNLWLNLEKLQEAMKDGVLPLPLIVNEKKMDPSSKENPGPKVIQLETAMGAAISELPGSVAVCVPFSRFAPVKTCNQLLGLRSDAYVISEDFTPVLAEGAAKPVVKLDDLYKMVPDMEEMIREGAPSLKQCSKLTVNGRIVFAKGSVCTGKVTITNEDKSEEREVGGLLEGDVTAAGRSSESTTTGEPEEVPQRAPKKGGLFCCSG